MLHIKIPVDAILQEDITRTGKGIRKGFSKFIMKKVLWKILLLWIIEYVLCGCGDVSLPEKGIPLSVPSFSAEPISNAEALQASEPAYNSEAFPAADSLPTSPVYSIECGEYLSVVSMLPNVEDHGEYLAEALCYYDLYENREEETESAEQLSCPLESGNVAGAEQWDFKICLPRFKENLPCYSQLNDYFEDLYEQLVPMKEAFYYEYYSDLIQHNNVYESYFYKGVTMGEHYLTVNMIKGAYYGGIRDAIIPMPVTFDLDTGESVTLPEILNCSEKQIEELVADFVYGYFLSQGDKYYIRMGRDTYMFYRTQYFYMMEQGVGVYYPQGTFDCQAAGDFLFVIPYEELYEKLQEGGSFISQ